MANQIDYTQPYDNVGAQNMMVKQALIGNGVGCIFVDGNPNGVVPGTLGQLAIDRVSTVVYQNSDNGTTWVVFGGSGPGSTIQSFEYTATGVEGATFEVLLPSTRASPLYGVQAMMGDNTSNVIPQKADTKLADRFTLTLSAAPAAGDVVMLLVTDLT